MHAAAQLLCKDVVAMATMMLEILVMIMVATMICAMVVIKVVSRSSKAGFSLIIDEGSIVMQTMPPEAQICSLGSLRSTYHDVIGQKRRYGDKHKREGTMLW